MIDRPALEAALNAADAPELFELARELLGRAWARLATRASEVPQPADDRLLTMKQVAARLTIPEERARELGRRGEIATVRIGRSVRVRVQDLERYVALRREPGEPGVSSLSRRRGR